MTSAARPARNTHPNKNHIPEEQHFENHAATRVSRDRAVSSGQGRVLMFQQLSVRPARPECLLQQTGSTFLWWVRSLRTGALNFRPQHLLLPLVGFTTTAPKTHLLSSHPRPSPAPITNHSTGAHLQPGPTPRPAVRTILVQNRPPASSNRISLSTPISNLAGRHAPPS